MYLIETYARLTTQEDKFFLEQCIPRLEWFIRQDLKYRNPKTRVNFFITIYHNIYDYIPSSDRIKMIDSFFDYMINNIDLLDLLEEISLYNLFEEKTYFGKIDNYLQNYHLQNKSNIEKLIKKLQPNIVENYMKNSDILNSFFKENYTFISWKSYYYIKTLASIGVDINKIPLSIFCKTFITENKIINWNKTKYSTKLIYFLIEIGYMFDSLYVNTHFNIYIKKMITHVQLKENCFRADNVIGRLCFNRSLQEDNIENIFKKN